MGLDFLLGSIMILGLTLWIPVLFEFIDTGTLQFSFYRDETRWYDFLVSTILVLTFIASFYLYFTFSTIKKGQTLGKYIMNLMVVTNAGEGLVKGNSAHRTFIQFCAIALWLFSIPMWLLRKDRKAWQDLATNTKVIDLSKKGQTPQRQEASPGKCPPQVTEMKKTNRTASIIMWLLWIWFAAAMPFYWLFLIGDTPARNSFGPVSLFMASMYFVPLFLTIVLRWVVIPRIVNFSLTLIPFFFGISLALTMTFFGIFIFQEYQLVFLVTSVLALLQFLPLFHLQPRKDAQ